MRAEPRAASLPLPTFTSALPHHMPNLSATKVQPRSSTRPRLTRSYAPRTGPPLTLHASPSRRPQSIGPFASAGNDSIAEGGVQQTTGGGRMPGGEGRRRQGHEQSAGPSPGYTCTHTHTNALSSHTQTNAHARTRMRTQRTRTPAHTHARTRITRGRGTHRHITHACAYRPFVPPRPQALTAQ